MIPHNVFEVHVSPYMDANSLRCFARVHSWYKLTATHVLLNMRNNTSLMGIRGPAEVAVNHLVGRELSLPKHILAYVGMKGNDELLTDDVLARLSQDRQYLWNIFMCIWNACQHNHLSTARRLMKLFEVSKDGNISAYEMKKLCKNACCHGNVEVAEWIISTYGAPLVHETNGIAAMFTDACSEGRLGMAKWLVPRFGITAEMLRDDFEGKSMYAFYMACKHGHLHVARWLVDEFQLTSLDELTVYDPPSMFKRQHPLMAPVHRNYSAEHPHDIVVDCICDQKYNVVAWVWEHFKVPEPMRVKQLNNAALLLCYCGDVRTFRDMYNSPSTMQKLSEETLDVCAKQGLQNACEHGQLDMVQWFIKTLNISDDVILDILTHDRSVYALVFDDDGNDEISTGFYHACVGGQLNIALWAYKTFGSAVLVGDTRRVIEILTDGDQVVTAKWLSDILGQREQEQQRQP